MSIEENVHEHHLVCSTGLFSGSPSDPVGGSNWHNHCRHRRTSDFWHQGLSGLLSLNRTCGFRAPPLVGVGHNGLELLCLRALISQVVILSSVTKLMLHGVESCL